jgi:hypothetical protein
MFKDLAAALHGLRCAVNPQATFNIPSIWSLTTRLDS